jgi:hypothetical protein
MLKNQISFHLSSLCIALKKILSHKSISKDMEYLSSLMTLFFLFVTMVIYVTNGEPRVPAFFIFGDSIVDVGNNNNNLLTAVKANFFPYGRDFVTRNPTGRMSNGKLAVDYACDISTPSKSTLSINFISK